MTERTRRQFTATLAAGAGVTLGGCLGGGGANRGEAAEEIEAAVAGRVVDIQIEAGPGVTLIDYISSGISASGLRGEIEAIVDAYLDAVDDYDLAHVEADVQNTEGVQIGEWDVEPQWLDRYESGSLTATGVAQLAVESFTA